MLPRHAQIKTDEGVIGDHVTDTQRRDQCVAPGDDQVQRVTGAMRRLRHVLDAAERLQQFRHADRVDVSIVDVNIKIAADNNRTSKRCKSLKS